MIDKQASQLQNEVVNVTVSNDGVSPYISIGDDQLQDLKEFLVFKKIPYAMGPHGEVGNKKVHVVDLGKDADVKHIQEVLDSRKPGTNPFGGREHVTIYERGQPRHEYEIEIPIQEEKVRMERKLCTRRCPNHPDEHCDGDFNHKGPCSCCKCNK